MNSNKVKNPNYSQDYSTSKINQKKNKLNLSPLSQRFNLNKIRKINSTLKKRINTEAKTNVYFSRRLKLNPNIKIINILNFEEKVDDILNTDLELEKQKEKIDKNKTIRLIRLGLYKKKEKDNNNIENNNEFETIAEKEKENENDLEKIDIENRDKEKKLEKRLKEVLNNLEQLRYDCQRINIQINDINKIIEDNQMEINVLTNYAEEFDKKYQEKLNNENNENNKDNKNNHNNNFDYEKENINDTPRKKKNYQSFSYLNKMITFKQQREDKKKEIKEKLQIKESIKQKLENDLLQKRNLCNKAKKELYEIRKKLVNSYHLKLYEGLAFHGEGLSMIIKDIWNLGVNVNVGFMPSYLDGESIDFLFKKAKQSIELNKIRQVIKDNETELAFYLKDWKKSNKEIKNIFSRKNEFLLNNINNNNKSEDNKNILNENELFKTKISDISISYLDPYPKTKQFMINYKKKHPNLFQRDLPGDEIKHMPFKSLNIPTNIIEKTKHIEKLKCLLEIKIEQNKQKDKKEVERLNREFIKNEYKERYEVNVETIFGALFGEEKKNDMLIYYTKLEKEYRDGKKIIQFHTKLNLKLK